MGGTLQRVHNAGVSIWRDDLGPQHMRADTPERAEGVTGLIVGPALLSRALEEDSACRADLRRLGPAPADSRDVAAELTVASARRAADVLRPVFEATRGVDGLVTVDLDPRLTEDSEAIAAQARWVSSLVGRPNLQVAIPATADGLPGITATLAAGVGVNAVLVFSADRMRSVLEAALDGLQRGAARTAPLTVSFSVSDLDTEVDKRLWRVGTDASAALRGTAALANARLAHTAYEEALRGGRWTALAGGRARRGCPGSRRS